MCMCMFCGPAQVDTPAAGKLLPRRRLLVLSAAAGGVLATGCTADQLARSNLVSDSEIAQLSARSWQETLRRTPVSRDQSARQRVRAITDRILRAGDIPTRNWQVELFEDPTPNAFALPGGQVGVHTGLLRIARSDDELATVIGHEIAHVIAEHGKQRVNAQAASQLGVNLVGAVLGASGVGNAGTLAGLLGAGVNYGVILPFSRENELEADRIGVSLMADAGYDPMAAVTLWERMAEASRGRAPPEWASTHPSDATRIARLREIAMLERARLSSRR